MLAQIKVVGKTETEHSREEDKCVSIYEWMDGEKIAFQATSYQCLLV